MAHGMSPRYASAIETERAEVQIQHDPLSADRTILANERTILAYVRTAVTLLAGGVTLINFFPNLATQILGWIILIPAAATMYIGVKRYIFLKKSLVSHFSNI